MTPREQVIREEARLREALALHVEAMGYPLAAGVIRADDELPDPDPDAVYVPVESLPGMELDQ